MPFFFLLLPLYYQLQTGMGNATSTTSTSTSITSNSSASSIIHTPTVLLGDSVFIRSKQAPQLVRAVVTTIPRYTKKHIL